MSRTTTKSTTTKPSAAKARSTPAQRTRTPPARPHRPARKSQPQASAVPASSPAAGATPAPAERQTKKATLAALLRREEGASVPEMMQVTGWLAHSVRAALTGLRRDGATLARSQAPDGTTRYRLAQGA